VIARGKTSAGIFFIARSRFTNLSPLGHQRAIVPADIDRDGGATFSISVIAPRPRATASLFLEEIHELETVFRIAVPCDERIVRSDQRGTDVRHVTGNTDPACHHRGRFEPMPALIANREALATFLSVVSNERPLCANSGRLQIYVLNARCDRYINVLVIARGRFCGRSACSVLSGLCLATP
jgi:hypothetical protein